MLLFENMDTILLNYFYVHIYIQYIYINVYIYINQLL